MKTEVTLQDMEFHARHGCLQKERREGNTFRVSVSFIYDAGPAAVSDRLEDAVDYGIIYKAVASCMEKPSNLLENVALRIRDSILRAAPGIEKLEVRVSKKDPPVGGPCAWSTVSLADD